MRLVAGGELKKGTNSSCISGLLDEPQRSVHRAPKGHSHRSKTHAHM